jgi:hypothetical protein
MFLDAGWVRLVVASFDVRYDLVRTGTCPGAIPADYVGIGIEALKTGRTVAKEVTRQFDQGSIAKCEWNQNGALSDQGIYDILNETPLACIQKHLYGNRNRFL